MKGHNYKHGFYGTRLYNTYRGIKERCYRKGRRDQEYYYDKGIKICDEWLEDNYKFFKWAMENGYNDNLTIDRIDSNGNYEPSNCRWVDYKFQASSKNKIKTNTSGFKGVTLIPKTLNKYNSRIMVSGKRTTIGTYRSKVEAAKAYDKFIIDNYLNDRYKTNKELGLYDKNNN